MLSAVLGSRRDGEVLGRQSLTKSLGVMSFRFHPRPLSRGLPPKLVKTGVEEVASDTHF